MKPEIQRYLEEHGERFTPEALRRGLLDAGYDPVEVDTALREWEAQARAPAAAENERRRFWWFAIGLHAAVLVLIGILSLAIGTFAVGGWGILIILAVVLLIGVGISGLVGRSVLRGSGLTIALLVPAISALLISGSCLALAGSLLLQPPPPPPRSGVMEVHIDPPLSFDGSSVASCQFHTGTGYSIVGEDFGTIDGRRVTVSIDAFEPQTVPGEPAPAPAPGGGPTSSLFISLVPPSEAGQHVYYTNVPTSRVELDPSPDRLSGSVTFAELEPVVGEGAPGEAPGFEPISGTLSWSCD